MSAESAKVKEATAQYAAAAVARDVPRGHKRTEAGVIPEDWEPTSIRDFAPLQRGFDLPTARLRPGPHPVVYSNGVLQHHDQALVKGPGVVTGRSGTIGKVHFVEEDYWPHNTALWVTSFRSNDPRFVYYLYSHINLGRFLSGSGVPTLNRNDVHQHWVAKPSPSEQRAIVEALSDVDGLLGALEALIAKKRAIKQAAMQQIVTGKTRLPGFSTPWEPRSVGAMGEVLAGKALAVNGPGTLRPYLRTKNVLDGRIDLSDVLSMPMTDAEFERFRLKHGDVLLNEGQSLELVGRCSLYADEHPSACGIQNQLIRFRAQSGVSGAFAAHLFRWCQATGVFTRIALQTTSVAHLGVTRLARLLLRWPPEEKEQAAIASVLSDMDAEVTGLERRHEKFRVVKQGMMQQLLTGRIRLLAPRASAAPAGPKPKGRQGHNWAFNEAVVIAVLAGHFGDEQHPLGRMRYTKLSYLLHRCTDGQVGDYLKKAAGPYNPKTRYGGPERIAVSNGYVREHRSGRFRGFVAAENNAQAEDYFQKWYGSDAIRWLEQFRWRRNEELEVLATVDVAAQELRAAGEEIDVRGVKAVLRRHGEWQAKLSRPAFSDASVARAIETARRLFGADGEAGGG